MYELFKEKSLSANKIILIKRLIVYKRYCKTACEGILI